MLYFIFSVLFAFSGAHADTETYPDPAPRFRVGAVSSFSRSGQIPTGLGSKQFVQIEARTFFGKWNGFSNPACLEERKREQAQYLLTHFGGEAGLKPLEAEVALKQAQIDEITESMLDPDLPESEETKLRNRREDLKEKLEAKKEQLANLKKKQASGEQPLDGVHNINDFFDVYSKNHPGYAIPYGTDNRCLNTGGKGKVDAITTPFEIVVRFPVSSDAEFSIPLMRMWMFRYIFSEGWAMNVLGIGSKTFENGTGGVGFWSLVQVDFNQVLSLRDDRGITLTLKGVAGVHYVNKGNWDNGVFEKAGKPVPSGRQGLMVNAGFTSRIKMPLGFLAEFDQSLEYISSSAPNGTENTSLESEGDLLAFVSKLKAGFQSESERWGVFAYVKREGMYQREDITLLDTGKKDTYERSDMNLLGGLEFEWHW